jgi:dTDP-D-glucose 4,6-dehydratase
VSSTLLITGAAGFTGGNFVRYWCHRHPQDTVVALDALPYNRCRRNLGDLLDEIAFVQGDARDRELVERVARRHRVDTVLDFTTRPHVLGTHQVSACEVYGPYQYPDGIVPLFVTRALAGRPLPVDAVAFRREWLAVPDYCEAVEAVLTRGQPGRAYHIGSGMAAGIETIADLVLAELNLPGSLKTTVYTGRSRDRVRAGGATPGTELGWQPYVPLVQGIRETIAWYRDNEAWWRPLARRAAATEPERVRFRAAA